MTPTRPYTGDIPETRTLSIFYKLKETDRGSPEPQRVGSNVTQQVRVTQPVSVAAAALESRGPLAPACGHNAPGKVGVYRHAGPTDLGKIVAAWFNRPAESGAAQAVAL